ncbi:MAG: FCD domain-containing protein [Ilumatobacter sp.]|nr:FCD domain-containing protein [Ilumatobacter sp.]
MAGRPSQSLAEHEAIVDAVVGGRPDDARDAMHRHLMSVIDALRHWEELRALG